MAAIADLKEQLTEKNQQIADARAAKNQIQAENDQRAAYYVAALDQLNGQIVRLVNQKDRLVQAIRDLKDSWNPAP